MNKKIALGFVTLSFGFWGCDLKKETLSNPEIFNGTLFPENKSPEYLAAAEFAVKNFLLFEITY